MAGRASDPPGGVGGGLIVIDKPAGWTSHDVVGRVRRLTRTRRVGHAGTLDPMATGVLLVGVGRATKLLGYLSGHDKTYRATIRLGSSTVTDDAGGDVIAAAPAAGISDDHILEALAAMVGTIEQVPSAVSAVKVDGKRAYARVRTGEQVELAARTVRVDRIEVIAVRRGAEVVDVDVEVDCGAGTYIRAIARDAGAALGVGGHLTALRRTRVGDFDSSEARSLEVIETGLERGADPVRIRLDELVERVFGRRDIDAEPAGLLAHGGRLRPRGSDGLYGAFGPDGRAVALIEERGDTARPVVVLRPA